VFTSFDPTGSMNTTINGVNDRGQLVGFFTNAGNQVIGFEATPGHAPVPVPEPGALASWAWACSGWSVSCAGEPRRRDGLTHAGSGSGFRDKRAATPESGPGAALEEAAGGGQVRAARRRCGFGGGLAVEQHRPYLADADLAGCGNSPSSCGE
jgi:hypothetical protein